MAKLFASKARVAPTPYPKLLFHSLRSFQLLASLIVGGIMAYFTWHLRHDDKKEPWTFIWLFSASLASILSLTFTICLHCLTGLRPQLNLAINSLLAFLWALSWSLLTWYMSPTLAHMCDVEQWDNDVGIMVCRIYKALFTFTLLGLVSTLAALGLDIYVRRKQTSRGMYRLQDVDVKNRPEPTRGPFTDDGPTYGSAALSAPRESGVWGEEPRRSTGPYNEQPVGLDHNGGYSHPEEFGKYDTGYRGPQIG
ncbi:hypothetical protein LTR37_009594 [Vermiconidia calcicola]|uniref:Uncharacterized protein n=1 Tax=Vermiconidia calcicola TaxID=1690605 RepID=A0ACC3N7F7_9PEZI|nr:hypothetical protein LTR37_009594 [Vermiconidia calcicola]